MIGTAGRRDGLREISGVAGLKEQVRFSRLIGDVAKEGYPRFELKSVDRPEIVCGCGCATCGTLGKRAVAVNQDGVIRQEHGVHGCRLIGSKDGCDEALLSWAAGKGRTECQEFVRDEKVAASGAEVRVGYFVGREDGESDGLRFSNARRWGVEEGFDGKAEGGEDLIASLIAEAGFALEEVRDMRLGKA